MVKPIHRHNAARGATAALLLASLPIAADVIRATPQTYRGALRQLAPGDTLALASGTYRRGLPLHRLHGRPGVPITIEGPPPERPPARLLAREGHNTVSLSDASHLVLRRLVLDGQGLAVDGVKAEGAADCRAVHHITLESLEIRNFARDRQIVGISTKCPAWSWRIRGNTIRGVGTGLYLGRPDGSAPFFRSIIEHNVVADTTGYSLQIKHQLAHPRAATGAGAAAGTVIRYNVFRKDGSAGPVARPSVLLGHQPVAGPGAEDVYFVYGNTFYENPGEALLQAEGNVAIYANVFVTRTGAAPAIALQPHHDRPRALWLADNTIVARGPGIRVRGRRARDPLVVSGNAVFAEPPVSGIGAEGNAIAPFALARALLMAPDAAVEGLDLRPRPGALRRPGGVARSPLPPHFPGAGRDLRGAPHRGTRYGALDAAGGPSPPGHRQKSPGLQFRGKDKPGQENPAGEAG